MCPSGALEETAQTKMTTEDLEIILKHVNKPLGDS